MSEFEQQIESWLGRPVVGEGGERLGTLSEVYLDEATGRPRWGLLDSDGVDAPFVPVQGLTDDGDELRLAVGHDRVASAPRVHAHSGRLEPEQEEELSRHYWGGHEEVTQVHAVVEPEREPALEPLDVTREHVAPVPAGGEPEFVRSEEELVISKTAAPVERVRLIKRVVTETVTKTFEVRREELHIEREPVERTADGVVADRAGLEVESRGDHFHENEEVIVLMEEEVVVTKRVVPRERVRLVTQTVVEDRQITDDLRREEVELERADLRSREHGV